MAYTCGPRHMVGPTLEHPQAGRRGGGGGVGAQSLAVDVFGSHGRSAVRPVLLPGSVPAPGSDTRHDARVRPSVSKECASLLPMWRDTARSLSVEATVW